jgi:hypothetical protein
MTARGGLGLGLVVAIAACSGDAPPCADAAVCAGACVATYAGNFSDGSRDAANCAHLTPKLELSIMSRVIGSPATISIDLGPAPVPGTYSSDTVTTWSAIQARSIDSGACVYTAGDQIVPRGSFVLDLAAVDGTTAHGTLVIDEYVHALEGTSCGAGSTETLTVVF